MVALHKNLQGKKYKIIKYIQLVLIKKQKTKNKKQKQHYCLAERPNLRALVVPLYTTRGDTPRGS